MGRNGDDGQPAQSEVLFTAAFLYYEKDHSQAQIATELGVSKATVSRLLARARETGIVKIQLIPPTVDPDLTSVLRDRLGLHSVHIAPGVIDAADPGPLVSHLVDRVIADSGLTTGDAVLVSWGRAVYSVARHLGTRCPDVMVAPALGGSDQVQPWFQPNEIARQFAANTDAAARYLHAPAYVSSSLKRSLSREPTIRAVLDLWETATLAVVGIGNWPKDDASLVAAGVPADHLAKNPGIGDVAGRFYTEDGRLVHSEGDLNLLAISPEQLRKLPQVVGIATGVNKVAAIVGAAGARLITTLITDAVTARAIADRLDGPAAETPGHRAETRR